MASTESFLRVLDKAHTGPICTVKDWNLKVLPEKVSQKLKDYRLAGTCDTENPINMDDGLADTFFKAGFELALESGLLCTDTERIIKVTEDEIKKHPGDKDAEHAQAGVGHDVAVFPERFTL